MFEIAVALLVSAWIEIPAGCSSGGASAVALLVSAWIEIDFGSFEGIPENGRTPCECVD